MTFILLTALPTHLILIVQVKGQLQGHCAVKLDSVVLPVTPRVCNQAASCVVVGGEDDAGEGGLESRVLAPRR